MATVLVISPKLFTDHHPPDETRSETHTAYYMHQTKLKLWGISYSIYKDINCSTYQQHPACPLHLLFFSSCPSFSSFCTIRKSQVIYISRNNSNNNITLTQQSYLHQLEQKLCRTLIESIHFHERNTERKPYFLSFNPFRTSLVDFTCEYSVMITQG